MRFYITCLLFLFSCTNLVDTELKLNSLKLDGGSWVQIQNNDFDDEFSLKILENMFTLEFWISSGEITNNHSPTLFMIRNENDEIELGAFQDLNQPDILRIHINGSIIDISLYDVDFSDSNEFNYYAFVMSSSIFSVYFNGQIVESIALEGSLNIDDNNLFIASKDNNEGQEPSNFWKGYIDEFRLWNIPLSNYYYYSPLDSDIDFFEGLLDTLTVDSILVDWNMDSTYECLMIDDWDTQNGYYQELENINDQTGCVCYETEELIYGCWSINPIINYHHNYPKQLIANYGDPLQDFIISLLRFNSYPSNGKNVSDESGNNNDGIIYSLPGYNAEFVEDGY